MQFNYNPRPVCPRKDRMDNIMMPFVIMGFLGLLVASLVVIGGIIEEHKDDCNTAIERHHVLLKKTIERSSR